MGDHAVAVKTKRGIYYGWVIAAVSVPLLVVIHGVTNRSFGLFFEPLQKDFGWSAATIALVFSLDRVEGGLLAPLTGYMTDRLGGRKMMLMGTAVIGLGFLLASQIHSLWQFFVAFLVVDAGTSMGAFGTLQAVLVRWFDKYLGRALGILNTAPTLSSVMIPIMAALITSAGWRTALALAGGVVLVVCLPLSLVIRPNPQAYGLLPDGVQTPDPSAQDRPPSPSHPSQGISIASLARVLREPAFWLIALSLALFTVGHQAERLLVIPHLQAQGFSRGLASTALTAGYLVAGPPTRLLMGWIADRFDVKRIFPLMFMLEAIGFLILANVTHVWQFMLFALVYETAFSANLAFGGVLVAQFFGAHRFATVRGLMSTVGTMAAVAGPVLGGAIFDRTGSYRLFFLLMSGVVLLGIPPILLTRRRPKEVGVPGRAQP